MAIAIEIRELVNVLNEQGFSLISGELLAELASPAEFADGDGSFVAAQSPTSLDVEGTAAEQVSRAVAFLKVRLVQPALHLAEAERIAGDISAGKALRILFVDDEGRDILSSDNREAPGEQNIAQNLDDILNRIRFYQLDVA